MFSRRKKRAIMGIGTLIIFIATILVAAVAAGVLISTSGVLQQRALITGTEARKKITNSLEVISILAEGDTSAETVNNFEIYVRLDAGSDPIQMRLFDIQAISENWDNAGPLQMAVVDGAYYQVGAVTNESWVAVGDRDEDGYVDYIRLFCGDNNCSNASIEYIQFNLSKFGMSNNLSLGIDLSNASDYADGLRLDRDDLQLNDSTNMIWGFVSINGNTTTNNTIDAGINFTIGNVTQRDECEFDKLIPERRFCYEVIHGNGDTVLDSGERLKLRYRTRPQNAFGTDQEFRFILSAEKGRLSEVRARTPDIVVTSKVPLWPLG